MIQSKGFIITLVAVIGALAAGNATGEAITTLSSFNQNTGFWPEGNVTVSANGTTLYGLTEIGGPSGDGTIFSVPITGGTPTVLASFNGADGKSPLGSLTLSPDGSTLYGMTSRGGGAINEGTIFSVPATGGTPTVLASFNDTDGGVPQGDLTLIGSTLYGVAQAGGAKGEGTIFSVSVTGGTPTVLFSFDSAHGASPRGDLTLSGSTFYGTAVAGGGPNSYGVVFSEPVTGGTPTVLASFHSTDGANPQGSVILSSDGSTLYGMTVSGGVNNEGTIFSVPVTGGEPNVLYSFDGAHGENPRGNLTLVGSTLYGMTLGGGANGYGVLFSIPVSGGSPTVLTSFDGPDGHSPYGSLTRRGSTLYGMTQEGGAGYGTIFSFSPVPEPSTFVLGTLGAIALGAIALRRRRRI